MQWAPLSFAPLLHQFLLWPPKAFHGFPLTLNSSIAWNPIWEHLFSLPFPWALVTQFPTNRREQNGCKCSCALHRPQKSMVPDTIQDANKPLHIRFGVAVPQDGFGWEIPIKSHKHKKNRVCLTGFDGNCSP